jgi:hypothetical protein
MFFETHPSIGAHDITRDGKTGRYFYDGVWLLYLAGADVLDPTSNQSGGGKYDPRSA